MRVLLLHSRYASGAVSGENRVVQDEARLLRDAGHEVIAFTPSVNGAGPLKLGTDVVWSRDATRKIRRLTESRTPEVIHSHNLFPMLSPAALRTAAQDAPLIMTLHNFRLTCLPATLLRDGQVCEDCVGHIPWRGIVHRCYRGSALASGALGASIIMHRAIRTFDRVRLFLAVSQFVKNKHVDAGISAERIRLKSNFAWPAPRREGAGDYFLYLGRLSAEKGLSTAVAAWRPRLRKLLVVGEGPERRRLRSKVPSGVELHGAVSSEEVPEIIARARALIVPSVCYEGAPRVVLEAYAAGVPVVASDIGGLPEVVRDGESGVLAPPGDATAWGEAIERLFDDAESERLGEGAYRLWKERYTPEHGLQQLEAAYKEVQA